MSRPGRGRTGLAGTGLACTGLVLALLAITGCRYESEPAESSVDPLAGAPDASIASAERPRGVMVGSGNDEPPVEPAEDPFRNFELREPGGSLESAVLLPLRIENGTGAPIVLTAEAGAEPVYLDSLGAGDTLRIDLETRAPAVLIAWTAVDGSSAGRVEVSDVADSVQVVRIGPSSAVR